MSAAWWVAAVIIVLLNTIVQLMYWSGKGLL